MMEKVTPSETSQNMIPNVTNANQNSNPVSSMQKSETKLDDSSKKQHPCTSCELSFDTKDELSAHLIEKHGYRRTYQCPICKKKFATKEAIKKHMVENHKTNDSKKSAEVKRKHQCMICDASFDDRQDLSKHINDVHDSFYKNAFLKKSQLKKPVKEQEQQNLSSVIQKPNIAWVHEGKKKEPEENLKGLDDQGTQDNESKLLQPLKPTKINNVIDFLDELVEPVHEENKKLEKFKADILANAKLQFKILKSKIQAKDSEEDAKTDKHGISYYC